MKRKMTKQPKEQQVDENQKKVAENIQQVLETEGYALQPFIQYSEFGLVPRVRPVKVDEQETNTNTGNAKQGKDTTEAKGTKASDGAAKA